MFTGALEQARKDQPVGRNATSIDQKIAKRLETKRERGLVAGSKPVKVNDACHNIAPCICIHSLKGVESPEMTWRRCDVLMPSACDPVHVAGPGGQEGP